jgi:hypothetical protein
MCINCEFDCEGNVACPSNSSIVNPCMTGCETVHGKSSVLLSAGYISSQPTGQPTGQLTRSSTTAVTNNATQSGQLYYGGGQYVKNKKTTDHESCEVCPAGRFSKTTTFRNRECKTCKAGTYAHSSGSTRCMWCPKGFYTKGQRGKKHCFDRNTVNSMRKLGWNFNSSPL